MGGHVGSADGRGNSIAIGLLSVDHGAMRDLFFADEHVGWDFPADVVALVGGERI